MGAIGENEGQFIHFIEMFKKGAKVHVLIDY